MQRDLEFSRIYPHPPELVWFALTSSESIAEWLMENDFQPEVGHRFRFRTEPAPGFDGIVDCEVLSVDEPRYLSYSWKGGPIDTIISFKLEPVPEGTRLIVEQTGFKGLKAMMVSFILGSGFKGIYEKRLPALLDKLARGEHPTLSQSGCATDEWPSVGTKVIAHVANIIPKK